MERLDKQLVARGLVATRTQAQRMIGTGRVSLKQNGVWQLQTKPGAKVEDEALLQVAPSDDDQYVSRGGFKLQGALAHTGLSPRGWTVLDLGQSTGGFTDCLLQAGADKVVGVDVGRDQLVPGLREDSRVVFFEGVNARQLPEDRLITEADAPGFDLAVMDVSFISQTLILPGLPRLLRPGGHLLSLVKPQFEVGKTGIGKGGIVRDASLYAEVQQRIEAVCSGEGLELRDYFASPIKGGDGNREFFVWAQTPPA